MRILSIPVYTSPESVAGSHIGKNINHALNQNGFVVISLAPVPSRGIDKHTRNKYKKIKIESFNDEKRIIIRFNLFREYKSSILRALRYITCNIIQIIKSIHLDNINVVFAASTPPTQGATAAIIKKIKKTPFVYNLQDIFPESLISTGITRKDTLVWKIGRVIENFTYRNADKIIVISEGFKKNIMDKGVPESKIEVIYNWVDENEVVHVDRDQNILFDRYELDKSKFYITYNGNIGLTQNMDLLLEVAEMFKEHSDIHFVIMGEGAYKKNVGQKISSQKIKNITLLPFQPYEEISHVFSMGDVGLVISKENVGQNSVPSKTWSIMSAARPVLASFDENSDLHEIIEKHDTGLFVKAGEKEALYSAILELYNSPEQRKIMGENGRAFILKNLTREIGTSKYVEVIKSVANKK